MALHTDPSCQKSDELESPYLKTPGALKKIYSDENKTFHHMTDWDFDPDHILLVKGISGEYVYEPFDLVLFDWRQGELEPFNIIDEYHRVKERAAQGKAGLIAYNDSGNLYLYDPKNGKKTIIAENGIDPDFSPDSEQLAFWEDGRLIIKNFTSDTPSVTIYSRWDEPQSENIWTDTTAWRPDGESIAFIRDLDDEKGRKLKSEIMLVNLDNSSLRTLYSVTHINLSAHYINDITWSPDGRMLAIIEEEWFNELSYLKLFLVEEMHICEVGSMEFPFITWDVIRWSPSGNIIAVSHSYEIYFIDVEIIFNAPYTEMKCLD